MSPEFSLAELGNSVTPGMLLDSDESKLQAVLFVSGSLHNHTVCTPARSPAQDQQHMSHSPAVHTAAGAWFSDTACLARPLPSAEPSSLSVSLFLSVQFSDVFTLKSWESQGMLYSLGWKSYVKKTVNSCPGG